MGGWAHITGRQGCHWLTPGLWAVMMNMAESLPAVGTALGQAAGALRTPAGERGGAGQGSPVQGPQVGKAPARRRGAGWGWGWKGRTRVPGFSEGAGQLEGAFSTVHSDSSYPVLSQGREPFSPPQVTGPGPAREDTLVLPVQPGQEEGRPDPRSESPHVRRSRLRLPTPCSPTVPSGPGPADASPGAGARPGRTWAPQGPGLGSELGSGPGPAPPPPPPPLGARNSRRPAPTVALEQLSRLSTSRKTQRRA